ncbi:DUF1156 domain-containing protein [Halobacterium yunchengense]|uniref:DUF1156 domain-containing protein n=1 Tax=Halobacterium yunchengense TaxID=3108497 RepID=UPI0030095814
MTDDNQKQQLRSLKVEDVLPVKAVGIECMKESIPTTMSPHRYLYKWFARRPTSATRLAILASILPKEVSNDELLKLMQIGPAHPELMDGSVSDYVIERRKSWEDSDESLEDHYGYSLPHSQTPNKEEIQDLHEMVKNHWDGELPTILDPTAGGGTIPMESLRYGLPTEANELNPVAWLINKVILQYAPQVGSLESDVLEWVNKIDDEATSRLGEFYPSHSGEKSPTYYFNAYSIECPSCGKRLPLSNRWWFYKDSATEGHAFRPIPHEDHIEYEHVTDVSESDFNPSEGTVSGGDAECPSCGVVTERDKITDLMSNGEFEYEICGVLHEVENGNNRYTTPSEEDKRALDRATQKIESNLELTTLLSNDRYIGLQDRAAPYGMTQWRDLFSPRQFLSHATYLQVFQEFTDEIREEYEDEKAEAVIAMISLGATKLVNRNSRLQPLDIRLGIPNSMLGNNNYAFQWHFAETNPTVGSFSYISTVEKVMEKYEEIVDYFDVDDVPAVGLTQGDASDLSHDDESVGAVVIDPPYGDNVMYSELSDSLYVWLREYLQDEFPQEFAAPETNKADEAVENVGLFDKESSEDSAQQRAREKYERKMSGIFSECHRVLERGGVLTVYFTDKEASAWDSLTMSLINSGFTISATHTITSEMPQRVGMRERASADSTLLLTCRKPIEPDSQGRSQPSLWSDIQQKTRESAQEKAKELLASEIELTKTDIIIGAFGPTLKVFTEEYPVVDKYDEKVRPQRALEEARTAVTEVLVDRELNNTLDTVDNLSKWYILTLLVYERTAVPYDDARQLGLGVGINIDEIKRDTKIWSKSKETLILQGQKDRVRDYTELESGGKRRKRAYPVDPRDESFDYEIDAVQAALNVLETKGSEFAWNWLNERNLQDRASFQRTIKSLLQVMPEDFEDYENLVNLASGETGELLDVNPTEFIAEDERENSRTTLQDF